jgi:hypothetical protein
MVSPLTANSIPGVAVVASNPTMLPGNDFAFMLHCGLHRGPSGIHAILGAPFDRSHWNSRTACHHRLLVVAAVTPSGRVAHAARTAWLAACPASPSRAEPAAQ